MIEPIHRQAILKLINYFTGNQDGQATTNISTSSSGEVPLYRFKESCDFINLPAISRLGIIISKFDRFFRPNAHILNGSSAASLKNPYNSVNILYLQQINDLVQIIELNLFDSIPNIRNEPISMDTSQALQSSEHLHALILIIKDWIQQFYIDENIIPSLFPAVNNERTIFRLVDIKENNICVWAILIFNVLYKLRDSFPEYTHVLDFSWSFLFYATMENLLDVVRFDNNFISSLLQTSLLYARMEEEQERQMYAGQYKQIETLHAKIVETKKRSQALAMTHGQGKGLGKGYIASTSITHSPAPQMRITGAGGGGGGSGGSGGSSKIPKSKSNKRGTVAVGGFLSNSNVTVNVAASSITTSTTNPLLTEKPYHCQSCNKTFPTSYKLNRHAYSHSGERPYQCTWPNCEKRFNDNYHLRRHTNTHTGDKPFPCKYPGCAKRYSRSEDLRNHQKTHYPNSGGGGGGNAVMTHHQTNTSTTSNQNEVSLNEHKFNLIAVQQQQQQQSQINNPSNNSIAVPMTQQQYTSLPVVTTSMVVAAHHQTPITMSSKAAQAVAAAAAAGAGTVTTDQVLVLNQLHMQLQQQHQQQQSNQQQQQSNNTFSSMSPVLTDEAAASLLLAQEQQQQQSTAASAVSQNHVAGLHSIADYNF